MPPPSPSHNGHDFDLYDNSVVSALSDSDDDIVIEEVSDVEVGHGPGPVTRKRTKTDSQYSDDDINKEEQESDKLLKNSNKSKSGKKKNSLNDKDNISVRSSDRLSEPASSFWQSYCIGACSIIVLQISFFYIASWWYTKPVIPVSDTVTVSESEETANLGMYPSTKTINVGPYNASNSSIELASDSVQSEQANVNIIDSQSASVLQVAEEEKVKLQSCCKDKKADTKFQTRSREEPVKLQNKKPKRQTQTKEEPKLQTQTKEETKIQVTDTKEETGPGTATNKNKDQPQPGPSTIQAQQGATNESNSNGQTQTQTDSNTKESFLRQNFDRSLILAHDRSLIKCKEEEISLKDEKDINANTSNPYFNPFNNLKLPNTVTNSNNANNINDVNNVFNREYLHYKFYMFHLWDEKHARNFYRFEGKSPTEKNKYILKPVFQGGGSDQEIVEEADYIEHVYSKCKNGVEIENAIASKTGIVNPKVMRKFDGEGKFLMLVNNKGEEVNEKGKVINKQR